MEREKNKLLLSIARRGIHFDSNKPLVSVIIPTYNKGEVLVERSIPSVLRQTYQNFEIIIVGDHCTDNTEELVRDLKDERIKFCNLPKRGNYPSNPAHRWLVAGTVPANEGLELASGEWIACMNDDDEFSEDHLEVLLNYAIENKFEMVYGVVEMEVEPNKWVNVGAYPLREGGVSYIAVLYLHALSFFRFDADAWIIGEPADWNLWKRMCEADVRIGFVDRIVGKHYLEKQRWGI